MKFLRHNISLVWAFAVLFVAQLFVPLAFAMALPEKGGVGIVICTSTGLKQLNTNGDLVPVGDDGSQQSGQRECLVCLTSGLNDNANLAPETTLPGPRLFFQTLNFHPDGHVVQTGQLNHGFNARAPPVCV